MIDIVLYVLHVDVLFFCLFNNTQESAHFVRFLHSTV